MKAVAILEDLLAQKNLSPEQISSCFDGMLSGQWSATQVAAALVLLRAKGARSEEIAQAAKTILEKAVAIKRPDYLFGDIVGTGGDIHNTINISTLASLTVAAAGFPVAKHGNVSVSSKCGSADLLRELGLDINLSPEQARLNLDNYNYSFLFAPNYHPSFKAVRDIRRELGIKTIFNILGPLVNPLRPPIMVIGVYDPGLLTPFAEALRCLGCFKALIVHGSGLDEVALHGPTEVVMLVGQQISSMSLEPADLGLKHSKLSDLIGGDAKNNAAIARDILLGQADESKTSAVAASAGALLWLGDRAPSWPAGVSMAMNTLRSGLAMKLIEQLKGAAHA